MTKIGNMEKKSTSKTGKKSPADFGKLGMNTIKANKAKTGKGRSGY
jgi:hypothetical protein